MTHITEQTELQSEAQPETVLANEGPREIPVPTKADVSMLDFNAESTGAPVGKDPKNPGRDDKVARMGTGSIPRLITEFAIPAIFSVMLNGAYNIIDSIFMGQAVGEIGLSVATVANPIMVLFLAFGMLVGNGGNALAALRLGEGKRVDAEKILGNTVVLALVLWVTIIVVTSIPSVMNWMLDIAASPEETKPYAASFIRILSLGFIFNSIGFGVNNFIRTAGAPNRALVTMLLGTLSCIAFNFLFVMCFGWGVQGSALATICGQAVACASVLYFFIFTPNVPLKLHWRYMKPSLALMGSICALGLASFAVQAGASIISIVTNQLLSEYAATGGLTPTDALAAFGVVQRLGFFTFLPILGTSVAIQPLLGYNYGARLIDRTKKIFWLGVAGATVISVVVWAAVLVWATPIVSVFGVEDYLLAFTAEALRINILMMPLVAFGCVGSNYFQSTGQPAKSIILSLTRQVLFLIPLMYLLPLWLPGVIPSLTALDAIVVAAPVSDAISAITVGIFIFFEMRRLKKLQAEDDKGTGRLASCVNGDGSF